MMIPIRTADRAFTGNPDNSRIMRLAACILVYLALSPACSATSEEYEQGLQYYENGEFALAIAEWEALAEEGDSRAQYSLGRMHETGVGVERDNSMAAHYYRQAAGSDMPEACVALGVIQLYGRGVPKDIEEGLNWIKKAADMGDAEAVYLYGSLHLDGVFIPRECDRALHWITMAADRGNGDAIAEMSKMYRRGLCVDENPVRAAELILILAEDGDPGAQMELAKLYAEGYGVPLEPVTAVKWFLIANPGKDITAYDTETVNRGRQLAEEWLKERTSETGKSTDE